MPVFYLGTGDLNSLPCGSRTLSHLSGEESSQVDSDDGCHCSLNPNVPHGLILECQVSTL